MEKENRKTQPLKENKEKWVCKKCEKEIELWGKNGFIPSCKHIKLGDDLEKVGIKKTKTRRRLI